MPNPNKPNQNHSKLGLAQLQLVPLTLSKGSLNKIHEILSIVYQVNFEHIECIQKLSVTSKVNLTLSNIF